MKSWDKMSTISVWGTFGVIIFRIILGKYAKPYFWPFFIVSCLGLSLYVQSEIMKYVIKIKERQNRMND